MAKPDIALIGRARSGKDTVANYLVREHGYVRVAFADALKAVALAANPYISEADMPIADLVRDLGWEMTKDLYPEGRRFLQDLGVAVRSQDARFWLDVGISRYLDANREGRPVVFTDVRFKNEAEELEDLGFLTVSLTRPCRITEGLDASDTHISETELDHYPTDRALCNSGTIPQLEADVRRYLLSE